MYLALFACAWIASVQFSFGATNLVACALAYLALAMIPPLCWRLRLRWVRWIAAPVTTLMLLPGYALGTVGALGLIFTLGDYLSPPLRQVILRPGLVCRVTGWGAVFSDEGYDIKLYRYSPMVPLIQRRVAIARVNETAPANCQRKATCETVARAWLRTA